MSLLDLQYFVCFYTTEVDYSEGRFDVRTLNVTDGSVPWGYVDINTGQDMCVSNSASLFQIYSIHSDCHLFVLFSPFFCVHNSGIDSLSAMS